MHKPTTDPVEQERIISEFMARREEAARERKASRWMLVLGWLPLAIFAGVYLCIHFITGSRIELPAYLPGLAFLIVVLVQIECRTQRIELKIDKLSERLNKANAKDDA